jgi:site-specific recombinase XerD
VDKTQIPVTQLVKSFVMYQKDRNHSPKTVEWYEGMLGRFSRFLGEEAKAGQFDLEAVRRYQRFLRGEQPSKFTLHAYSRTLKTFLRWLGKEAYIGQGPLARGRNAEGAALRRRDPRRDQRRRDPQAARPA